MRHVSKQHAAGRRGLRAAAGRELEAPLVTRRQWAGFLMDSPVEHHQFPLPCWYTAPWDEPPGDPPLDLLGWRNVIHSQLPVELLDEGLAVEPLAPSSIVGPPSASPSLVFFHGHL